MRSCALLIWALILGMSACSGPPEGANDPPDEPPLGMAEAGRPHGTDPPPTRSVEDEKKGVLQQILKSEVPKGWIVSSAYDLGEILIATLSRGPESPQLTALAVSEGDAGWKRTEVLAAFAGSEPTSHPLEVLGYDLVQPRAVSNLILNGQKLPRIDYAWLRVNPESGTRTNGSGSAIWMHCGLPVATARPGRFVVISSEAPAGRYDATTLVRFVGELPSCNVR